MELVTTNASSSLTRLSFNGRTIGLTDDPLVSESKQEEPRTSSQNSSDTDFEFETTLKFEKQEPKRPQHGQILPLMSFADELFCNGQVRPLKLPPRLQCVGIDGRLNNQNLIASSPTSPSSVLKGPFRHWSFKNNDFDDFDPFMVALENVRKDVRPRVRDRETHHRRTRSLSPLRTNTPQWSNSNDSTEVQHYNQEVSPQQPQEPSRSARPAEPEGSVTARPIRRMIPNSGRPIKPTLTTLPGPTVQRSESLNKCAKGHHNKEGGSQHPQQPSRSAGPAEPEGSVTARPIRWMRSNSGRPIKPTLTTLPGPTVQRNQSLSKCAKGHHNIEVGPQHPQQPNRNAGLANPEGSVASRPIRQMRSNSGRPIKPTLTTLPGPTVKRSKSLSNWDSKSDGPTQMGCSGRLSLKEFLFRSASEGRADSKDKLRSHTEAVRKNHVLRNLSFKSMHETHYHQKKEMNVEMRKKTLIPYKAPCFLVCLGFGPRGLRNLS